VTGILGSGGFGIVLKAVDPALGRAVAIKVLAPQLATSAAARSRFAREARAAAAVVHDHVLAIHAIDSWNSLPYLVMPYIAGCSLQERVDRDGPLEAKEVLRIGMQTAQGLAAAHAQGLVHRDVKPSNILLENGIERVKLTDFGLARAVDDASLTASGVVAGTPEYMSPEQAGGDGVDHRSDLFSLGSVVYFMCAGRPPFRADSTPAVLRRVSDDQPRPLGDVNPEVPLWLVEIVARLHAKNPVDRFQSAADVAGVMGQYLAALQRGLPIDAAPSSPEKAPPARPGRKVAIVAAVSIPALALAVAALVIKDPPVRAPAPMLPYASGSVQRAELGAASGPQVVTDNSQDRLIIGSGNAASKTWGVSGFTEVQIDSSFHAQIAKGKTFRVTTSADDNVLPFVRVTKDGSTLKIGMEPHKSFQPKQPLEAEITLPTLAALDLNGASHARLQGFKAEKELLLKMSGASTLGGSIEVATADFRVNGASTLSLGGSAVTARLSAAGASHLKLGEFAMKECELKLAEASHAQITVRSDAPVKAKLADASHLSGSIEATNVELELDGASHAKLGGAAKSAKLSAAAASHLALAALAVQDADITLSGASHGSVAVTSTLKGRLRAGSHLTSRGDPTTIEVTKSGGSTFSRHR
jgi:serine/threonine-protein kinase